MMRILVGPTPEHVRIHDGSIGYQDPPMFSAREISSYAAHSGTVTGTLQKSPNPTLICLVLQQNAAVHSAKILSQLLGQSRYQHTAHGLQRVLP